jgi:hypothetical protein
MLSICIRTRPTLGRSAPAAALLWTSWATPAPNPPTHPANAPPSWAHPLHTSPIWPPPLTSLRHLAPLPSFSASPYIPSRHAHSSSDSTGGWTVRETLTLANSISLARLASGPLIASLIIEGRWPLALGALGAAGASDWLDGYFARRSGTVSVLGSYLDPLADKVLIVSVVGALGYSVRCMIPVLCDDVRYCVP